MNLRKSEAFYFYELLLFILYLIITLYHSDLVLAMKAPVAILLAKIKIILPKRLIMINYLLSSNTVLVIVCQSKLRLRHCIFISLHFLCNLPYKCHSDFLLVMCIACCHLFERKGVVKLHCISQTNCLLRISKQQCLLYKIRSLHTNISHVQLFFSVIATVQFKDIGPKIRV